MTIKAKLLGVFFGSILFICVVLAAVLMRSNSVSNTATGALAEKFNELEHLQGVSIAFKTQVQEWKNILLRGADSKQKEKYAKGFNEQSELIRKGVDELKPLLTGENARLLSEFAQAHDQLASKYMSAKQEFLDGAQFDAKAADHAVKGLDRKVLDPIEKLLKNLSDEVHHEVDATKTTLNNAFWSGLAIALSIALAVLVLGWRIVTYLSNSLSRLTERLIELSGSLNGNAGKITQAGSKLSASSNEQASAVHETSVAARQISSMLERSTENAKNAIHSVEAGQNKSREGLQAVNAVLGAISDIHGSNQQLATAISASNKNLSNITSVIADIGNKTKVIHDIVFQTKLLSFNASVEAARAGEHGKGFAVVAEEIGNLARMSGSAAQEIAQLLAESLQSVSSVIGDTQRQLDELTAQSRAKVEIGEQVANECGRAIEEVSRQIQEVASISSSIAQATNEQAQGVQQIASAMSQLNETSEQTADVAGQTDHVASSLNEQSRELNELVSELQTMIGGQESRAA